MRAPSTFLAASVDVYDKGIPADTLTRAFMEIEGALHALGIGQFSDAHYEHGWYYLTYSYSPYLKGGSQTLHWRREDFVHMLASRLRLYQRAYAEAGEREEWAARDVHTGDVNVPATFY